MRRTFPQKVKPVPCDTDEHEVTTAQVKQALPNSNRRARTSAAMVGLALSMGAYSTPLVANGDGAIAAEPVSGEPVAPTSFETASLSSSTETSQSPLVSSQTQPLTVKHTVQEGQTLWDIARFYKVPAPAIASANSLSYSSVLRVGQVLTIPTDSRLAQAAESDSSSTSTVLPSYYGPVSGQTVVSGTVALSDVSSDESDLQLKAKQGEAVAKLKQKRESLRQGLATLSADRAQLNPSGYGESFSSSHESGISTQLPPSELADGVTSQAKPQSLKSNLVAQNNQSVAYNPYEQVQTPLSSQTVQPKIDSLGSVTYRVNRGDTLGTIARSYGISVQQLVAANRIANPNYVLVDQVLVIPQTQATSNGQQPFKVAIASVQSPSSASDEPKFPMLNGSTTPPKSSDAKVASSFIGTTQAEIAEPSSTLVRHNHIESLKQEIGRLREKYQSQASFSTPSGIGGNPASSVAMMQKGMATGRSDSVSVPVERVNPEFKPNQSSSSLRAQIRDRFNQPQSGQRSAQGSELVQSKPQSQVVAAAPIGSEGYDPLVRSKIGQAVSPDVPSLGPSDAYLPSSSGNFNGYIWPTKGVITSGYGWRWGRMHKGLDIAGPIGTPIVAAADGVVTYAGWNSGGYGYLVEVQHADGSMTLYAHNNRILVQVGQQVAQGQQVAEMGSTGYSTGPHLHFEVHPSGKGAVNPVSHLPRA